MTTNASHALRGCIAAAQADAERFHGDTTAPSGGRQSMRRLAGWLLAGLLLGASAVAGVARQLAEPPLASAAPPASEAPVTPAGTPQPLSIAALPSLLGGAPMPMQQAQAQPALSASTTFAGSAENPPTLHADAITPRHSDAAPAMARPRAASPLRTTVQRDGAALRIDVAGMPRPQAAQLLAAATGSELIGDPAVLAATRALTLDWRGSDVAAAWRALLDGTASYAIDCSRQCRVWLLGALPRSGATSAGDAAGATAAPTIAARGDGASAGQAVVVAASPADSDVSAGSAAMPAQQPMQPDPPGLFPSE